MIPSEMSLQRLREAVSAYSMQRDSAAQQHAEDLAWAVAQIECLRAQFARATERIAALNERLAKREAKPIDAQASPSPQPSGADFSGV